MAKKRYDSNPDSIRIMFYFKDAPPASLSDINPLDLQRVKAFQKSLGDAGGLYRKFKTAEEFEKTVNLHLTLYLQDFLKSDPNGSMVIPEVSAPIVQDTIDAPESIPIAEDDEIGVLDLEEELLDNITGLEKVNGRILSATEEIGEKMQTRTQEINALAENQQPTSRRQFKSIVNRVASDMHHYSARMDAEIPLFKEHLDSAMTIFTKIVPLYSTFGSENDDMMPNMLSDVEELKGGLDDAERGMAGFRDNVSGLPPMTSGRSRKSV